MCCEHNVADVPTYLLLAVPIGNTAKQTGLQHVVDRFEEEDYKVHDQGQEVIERILVQHVGHLQHHFAELVRNFQN